MEGIAIDSEKYQQNAHLIKDLCSGYIMNPQNSIIHKQMLKNGQRIFINHSPKSMQDH